MIELEMYFICWWCLCPSWRQWCVGNSVTWDWYSRSLLQHVWLMRRTINHVLAPLSNLHLHLCFDSSFIINSSILSPQKNDDYTSYGKHKSNNQMHLFVCVCNIQVCPKMCRGKMWMCEALYRCQFCVDDNASMFENLEYDFVKHKVSG